MKFGHLFICILIIGFWGCGEDVSDRTVDKPIENDINENILQDEEIDTRFVSRDRDLKNIFSDYEKPLQNYPQIWQDEAVIQKTEGRENITDEPFTGTVVESFEDLSDFPADIILQRFTTWSANKKLS